MALSGQPGMPMAWLVYDEHCGFCRVAVAAVVAWDLDRHVAAMPLTRAEAQGLLTSIPAQDRPRSWHLYLGGTLFSAGAVFAPLLELLLGGRPLAWLARRFPRACERGYRFVAGRRGLWGRHLPRAVIARADRRLRDRDLGDATSVLTYPGS